MNLKLKKLRTLESTEDHNVVSGQGCTKLKVLYCGICRTDAKIWAEGHRDIVLPRVLGHEISALNEDTGELCTVWPGRSCGQCIYCKSGRENLCEEMKIMGFHIDGGFSDYILVPEESIIYVDANILPYLLCFAEPLGCVLNVLDKVKIKVKDRIIIYGGGILGLLTALICIEKGAKLLIIEKNEDKIAHINQFINYFSIECKKDTIENEFDIAINACSEISAFSRCITKLKKGGELCYFSSLRKNEKIETNLANLIHYKENIISGAYGLKRQNMIDAIDIISRSGEALDLLIEEKISPEVVPEKIANVLTEKSLKYIIDFSLDKSKDINSSLHSKDTYKKKGCYNQFKASEYITSISKKIISANNDFYASAQQKIDNKTKPLGALGRLENFAIQMCMIQNSLNPSIFRKSIFVFAGDHGVVEEGVSAYPAEVTGEMVDNFLNGGAAVNILAKCNNIDLTIIDAGVNKDFDVNPDLINKKISKGTRNFAVEKAMTRQEAIISIENGMNIFFEKYTKSPIDIIGLGEMGIGNTTSASAIISAVTGVSVKDVTGRGTGIDDKGIERKIETIEKALSFHNLESKNPLDILEKIGGYEIGGMVGTAIAAASKKTAIVLDGIISTAAGLLAYLINPLIKEYLISGHKSIEIGQMAALAFIGIEPALDLGMRLGEGTGAALTIHLVEVACSIMRDMASFEEANVSKKI